MLLLLETQLSPERRKWPREAGEGEMNQEKRETKFHDG